MRPTRRQTLIALTALCLTASALAEERGSKDEAKALADAAYDHVKKVGAEKAYKDFTTDKAAWTKKDLYVMAFTNQCITLAHGGNEKLVGKDLSMLKDATGTSIVGGLVDTAAKGGGWFDYEWPDPLTKKVMPKSTYARKLPAGDGMLGVGIYR